MRCWMVGCLGMLNVLAVAAPEIIVDPATRHQTIVGLGAGGVYYQNWLTEHPHSQDIYDTMFTGLGLSLLRVGNWNQDESAALEADSLIVAEGKKRLGDRMRILMSSWSAPASLKANNLVDAGNSSHETNTLKKVEGKYVYDQFAGWWLRSLMKYRGKGIAPAYITIQNEPDMNTSYASMILLPGAPYTVYPDGNPVSVNTATFPEALRAVHDSLAKLENKPAILGPEVLGIGYNNFRNYNNQTDTALLDGYAFHLYHGNDAPANDTYRYPDGFNDRLVSHLAPLFSTKPTIMTEFCPMRDPVPGDMIAAAQIMQNMLTKGWVNGYISWELYWKENGQAVALENPWNPQSWETPQGFRIHPEYHALRHFSRFVSPGWDRVAAISPDTALRVSAFASSAADTLTLVAVHLGITSQAFSLAQPAGMELVELWQSQTRVVGGRLDDAYLSQKIASTAAQTEFTLPDSSITTFVWVKRGVNRVAVNPQQVAVPASYRVYDALGNLVGAFAEKPMGYPAGIWLVESLDARGNRIAVQRVRFY